MSSSLEHALHYPLGDSLPEPGRSLEVAPGVRWVRMGLPFALDHINVWLLRDEIDGRAGWSIVDCGITSDATRAAWEQVFAHELAGLPVLRVIVTHMHPDHIGLAHWLCERWGCRLWISLSDYNAARISSQSTTSFGGEAAAAFFASHGLTDPDAVQKVRARANYYGSMVPQVPAQFRRLLDGQELQAGSGAARHTWRCIAGYGHAPEHIALFAPALAWQDAHGAIGPAVDAMKGPRAGRGVLISGDMVLPRISTNVSVHDLEPEGDPLPLYLASIERLKTLPADTLVLPSHGRPFVGLHTRIAQLSAHHDERFDRVMRACSEAPRSAADLLPVLFHRALDLHQTTFAMGEAIAHLHALWHRGALRRAQGTDGVLRFSVAA
jgi:glyoxylase-like metal-dependent hydrolase (beta-lactamase superfamily II)